MEVEQPQLGDLLTIITKARWWFQRFFEASTPIFGVSWSNLTSIFFRWVVQPPTTKVLKNFCMSLGPFFSFAWRCPSAFCFVRERSYYRSNASYFHLSFFLLPRFFVGYPEVSHPFRRCGEVVQIKSCFHFLKAEWGNEGIDDMP